MLPTPVSPGAFQNLSAPRADGLERDRLRRRDRLQRRRGGKGDGDGRLSEKIEGVRGVDGGALENSRYVESITALLLNINRRYKGAHSMVKISGV